MDSFDLQQHKRKDKRDPGAAGVSLLAQRWISGAGWSFITQSDFIVTQLELLFKPE